RLVTEERVHVSCVLDLDEVVEHDLERRLGAPPELAEEVVAAHVEDGKARVASGMLHPDRTEPFGDREAMRLSGDLRVAGALAATVGRPAPAVVGAFETVVGD